MVELNEGPSYRARADDRASYSHSISSHAGTVDFTLAHYVEMLRELALPDWSFIGFSGQSYGTGHRLLMRHDVDVSLNRALAMARAEADLGVKTTYFVRVRSEFYNLLEENQAKLAREIAHLGHDIGLHLDVTDDEVAAGALGEQLQFQAGLVAQVTGLEVGAFSFHNPTSYQLQFSDETYGGLVNSYSDRLFRQAEYISDSNGYWRYRSLVDVLSLPEKPVVQVLIHPELWQDDWINPRQRITRSVLIRALRSLESYDDVLKESVRENRAGKISELAFYDVAENHDWELFSLLDSYPNSLFLNGAVKEAALQDVALFLSLASSTGTTWRISQLARVLVGYLEKASTRDLCEILSEVSSLAFGNEGEGEARFARDLVSSLSASTLEWPHVAACADTALAGLIEYLGCPIAVHELRNPLSPGASMSATQLSWRSQKFRSYFESLGLVSADGHPE